MFVPPSGCDIDDIPFFPFFPFPAFENCFLTFVDNIDIEDEAVIQNSSSMVVTVSTGPSH